MNTQTFLLLLIVAAAVNVFLQSNKSSAREPEPAPRRFRPPATAMPDDSAFTSPDLEHEDTPVQEAQASLMLDSKQVVAPTPDDELDSPPASHYEAVVTQAVRMGFMPLLRAGTQYA